MPINFRFFTLNMKNMLLLCHRIEHVPCRIFSRVLYFFFMWLLFANKFFCQVYKSTRHHVLFNLELFNIILYPFCFLMFFKSGCSTWNCLVCYLFKLTEKFQVLFLINILKWYYCNSNKRNIRNNLENWLQQTYIKGTEDLSRCLYCYIRRYK